jgi:uncharacterized membrane protein YqhA
MKYILKYSILVVVLITFFNALVYFGLGVAYSIEGYQDIFSGHMEKFPGVKLVEALDRFLIGFVFIIFSVGLSRLFLPDFFLLKHADLPWLKIDEFHQLKMLLISALIIAMFVAWAPSAINHLMEEEKQWTVLLFPTSLLILAVAAKFLKGLQ